MWAFFDFRDDAGRNVIREWIAELPPSESEDVLAELDTRILILSARAVTEWRSPYSEVMAGSEWAGINELRIKVNRNQYRVLYCFGPGRSEVVLLAGYLKRDSLPRSAAITAQARKGAIGERNRLQRHFA